MDVCITYWYHSCFTLESDKKVMLFDYPGRGIDDPLDEKIGSMVKGSELYVFVSHSHGDHFSPDVAKFSSEAEKAHFILADDVPVKRMVDKIYSLSSDVSFTEVKPDESHRIDDLKVRTWKSNDAGVAFLIYSGGKKIYFAGDLAKWNWPEWGEQKVKEHVEVFDDVVEGLEQEEIDIAFSNMDERLPSWAGPIEFIERVKPKYFIPMHTFGNESWIDDLIGSEIKADSEIFHYEKSGDRFFCDI